MGGPIRVLLVDDHALFRRGLAACLAEEGGFEVVGEAADGQRAFELCGALSPDLVLMDVFMPGCGGVEATRRIKAEYPGIGIVMLTVSADDRDVFEAIRSGAKGYLIKDVKPADLRRQLRGILAGEAALSPSVASKIVHEFARRIRPGARGAGEEGLTPRERQVIALVAAGQTNRKIATALAVSQHTVKKHLRNILGKLHLHSRDEAIAYVHEQGSAARRPPP